jgi:alpha-ketoglutarate-dependent taurine dioxygenase
MNHITMDVVNMNPFVRRRRAVRVNGTAVKTEALSEHAPSPLIVRPILRGLNLEKWLQEEKQWVLTMFRRHGALLFRGFEVSDKAVLNDMITCLDMDTQSYINRSTPRRSVKGRIYTTTEYPADQTIPQHNEMSYTSDYPLCLALFCVEPPHSGGETPISDCRRVLSSLSDSTIQEFSERKIVYTRLLSSSESPLGNSLRLDLSWQEVFQTDQSTQVDKYCLARGIEDKWMDNNMLFVRETRPPLLHHPVTGELVWFNQAHLFHPSSLKPQHFRALQKSLPEKMWPRNVCFDGGEKIPEAALDDIRSAYSVNKLSFRWQKDDALLLDNMLFSHGRNPFQGTRKILIAMGGRASS